MCYDGFIIISGATTLTKPTDREAEIIRLRDDEKNNLALPSIKYCVQGQRSILLIEFQGGCFCVRGFFVVMVCAACGCRVENASQTRCGWIRAIPAATSGQQPGTYPDDAQDALPGALTWWLFVCNDCLDFCYSGLVRLYPSRFNSYWYRTVRIFHGPHGPAAMRLAWSDERKAKRMAKRLRR